MLESLQKKILTA